MKIKSTQILLLTCFLLLGVFSGFSQVKNDFDIRYEADIRGELTFIANNIVNRQSNGYWQGPWWNRRWVPGANPNDPYNDTGNASDYNDNFNMQYIDVDTDASTFSSSSSTLVVPDADCAKIRYAGLYWSAVYVNPDRSNIDDIKFQVPGGAYQDITADEILFDGDGDVDFGYYSPYACYKDVTSMVAGLANPNGDYFVANVRASSGNSVSGGVSGGWTMVVVYENPNLPGSKYITTFDGYAGIKSGETVNIPISGFTTLPAPFQVNANIAVAALEGDNKIGGDGLAINANGAFTSLNSTVNPVNNFFNSNISIDPNIVTTRNPNSVNTLGWDVDLFPIQNQFNNVIPNDATSAILRASSSQDKYDIFFASFDVEIIAPNIVLEKKVNTPGGVDITGQGVHLGQTLDYVLTFQNIGNDDGNNYTIRDVLPTNVAPPNGYNFTPSDLTLPPGVTYVYDFATKTIVFTIPNNLIAENDPAYSIRMRVSVAENCFDFVNACSDLIENLAFSTYSGIQNSAIVTDDPSVTDFDSCGFIIPGATNFLLDDLSDCTFERTVELCGASALLDAGDDFDDYIWVRDDNGNDLFDSTDTVITDGDPDNDPSTMTVTTVGTYIVDKIVADPCKGFKELIRVVPYGSGTIPHPIIDYFNAVNNDSDLSNDLAGEIVQCSIDNDMLPKLFLCGIGDTRLIQVNILDAQSIVWEKLDEGSCSPSGDDCANKNLTCSWNPEGTGNNYTVSSEGKYRLSITYQNGCTSRFFFNVFLNNLDIQFNKTDIICATDGNITITNLGAGYGYQLVDDATGNILIPFSANNGPSFDFTTGQNGAYRVQVTPLDASGTPIADACVFETPIIGILERNVQYTVTPTGATCNALGSVNIQVNNAEANYEYEIRIDDGTNGGLGTLLDSESAQIDNNFTFTGLNPGDYIAIARTDDGCSHSEQITITDNNDLLLEARVSQHITCKEGNIIMDSSGGKTPHSYAIWSYVDELGASITSYPTPQDIPPSEFQTSQIFDILNPGDYTFVVVDRNSCFVFSNTISIEFHPAAEFNPTSVIDVLCFGDSTGEIQLNLDNANGYQLTYYLFEGTGFDSNNFSLANALDTNTSGYFPGLPSGNYEIVISQRKGSASCDYFENYTISAPTNALGANSALIQDYTCTQDAIIEAQNIVGGTAPYEYSIDGVNFIPDTTPNANRFENLTDGTYTITVRDASGCTLPTTPITIDPLNEPSDLSFNLTQPPNCPDETSDVTVTVVDGNAPFVFEIIAPSTIASTSSSGNTANFNDLAPGTYTFNVTDAKNCSYTESYTINPVVKIDVVGSLVSNISCFSDTDGEALFTVSGISTNYNYTITGPSNFNGNNQTNTSIPLNNLDDGTYTITVTDNGTNCTDTATVTVQAPANPLTISFTETQPSCTTDGSVLLTSSGGWGSNTFSLTYPDGTTNVTNTSGSFTGLSQTGVYSASVSDTNGCIVPTSFTLNAAVAPVLQIVPNAQCYTSAAGLTLTANVVSGGDGNFEFSLNGGIYGSANTFSGLAPGNHTIAVRDGKNCTDTESIIINPELTVSAFANPIPACGSTTDITITAAGGDGNFVYSVVNNGATPSSGSFSSSNTRTMNSVGDYDVYVRDNNGNSGFCEAKYDITIAKDDPPTISVTNTPVLCSGTASASITITPSGGSSPYRYSIDNGATYQTSDTFSNLAADSYNIQVLDSNNCSISEIYAISEPFTLSASALVAELIECNPSGAEVRIINARGGTAPYEYSFDGGATYGPDHVSYLFSGVHTLFIRDANNCSHQMEVTVLPPFTPPGVTTTIDYACDGEGTITIIADDPSYNYTYELDAVLNTPETSNVFDNIPPGNHTVTVNYEITIVTPPSVLLFEDFGFGTNTPITQIDPAYCYEPQDGSTSLCGFGTNTELQDGEYVVTQGLVNTYPAWLSPNDHTGNTNGRFLAINVGGVAGVGGIIYAKRDVEVLPNQDITISLSAFNLLRNGTSGGDPSIEIQLVDPSGTVIANTTTGNVPKNNGADDWHDYSVTLNPGSITDLDIVIRTNSAVIDGNDIGIDDILATQPPAKCPASVYVDVLVEDGHELESTFTSFPNVSCNGATDGSLEFEVNNFDLATGFVYSVNSGPFSAVQTSSPITLNGLGAGSYDIIVQDALDSSCSITISHTITEPTPVVATATITEEFTCNNTGATITASASGGTPTYQFQLEDTSGGIITAYQSATTFTGVVAGDYIIRVIDANNCDDSIVGPVTVTPPDSVVFDLTATSCYSGNGDATIQVNVTGGNNGYQFSINNGPWEIPSPASATTYTFNNLFNSSYTIDVRDQFGCTAPQQSVTIDPEIVVTATAGNIDACSTTTDVDITAVGGDGNYVYAIVADGVSPNSGDFAATNPVTVTGAGDYDVYVRDNNGAAGFCEAAYDLAIVQDPPITITPAVIHNTCFGGMIGSISLTAGGGQGPYEYSIDNGTTYQTSDSFFNLTAGDFNVRIRDDKNCDETVLITITEPAQIIAEAVQTEEYTCLQDGEITVGSVSPTSGGSGSYQYSLNGGTWTATTTGGAIFTDLVDGTYTISVRDAADISCIITLADIIIAPLPIEPTLSTTVNYNCDGSGDITVLPNDPAYTYSIDAGASQASNLFTGIAVGTHTVTVDYGKDCTVDIDVIVEPGMALDAAVTASTNISCNGLSDGTITFEVENFDLVNGFEYSVNAGAYSTPQTTSPVTITGLSAGINTIEIRDVLDNSCTVSISQTLTEPTVLSVTAGLINPLTCITNATIGATTTTGGTTTYEYQLENAIGGILSPYQAATDFANLTADDYVIRVRDANNCEATSAITITAPEAVTFTASGTACYSGGTDAQIDVTVTNVPGNGGFQFNINGGPWLTPTPVSNTTYAFTGLGSGSYDVNVKDQFGCIGTPQTIVINPLLSLSATAPSITACGTTTDVTLTAAGGDGNFVFAIVADGATPSAGDFNVTNPRTVTGAGDYDVYVRDNTGAAPFCEASYDLTITQDAPLVITPTLTHVLCNGNTTGAIALAVVGGNAPYEYQLENTTPSILIGYKTTSSFLNLAAGDYVVRVRDAKGCEVSMPVTLNEPDPIFAEATITEDYTCEQYGHITVGDVTATTGGSGDYQYRINGGAWSATTTAGITFTDLADDTYTIDVRDANATSCIYTIPTNVVIDPLPVEPTLSTSVEYNCDGSGNIIVLPNDPTYTYSIDAGASQTSNLFTSIAVGTHTVTVDYGKNCKVDIDVIVEPGNALDAAVTVYTDISCYGLSDGAITFEVENFDPVNGFEYSVNAGAYSAPQTTSPVTITGLGIGVNTIDIRDVLNNSCIVSLSQNLTQPTAVVASASITAPFTCNNLGATITASALGGTPGFEYQLEDDLGGIIRAYQIGTTFTNVADGVYIVRARDRNLCSDPIDTAITVVAPTAPTFIVTPTACYSGASDGSIQVDVTSVPGNGGFQFRINSGPWMTPTPATGTSYTFQNLSDGTFTIDVKDSYGCIGVQQSATINPQLTANAVLTDDLTCLMSATVTINANGGSGTYLYEWSNDGGATYATTNFAGNVFTTNVPDTYIFRVTNTITATSCSAVTETVIVTPAEIPIIASVTPTNILCNGESTGSLNVTIDTSVGRPAYMLEVIETISSTNYGTQTSGLPAGDYEITVTDDKGCTSLPFAASITQPDSIAYGITLVPITCNTTTGTDPGSITVESLTGGVAPFTYYLTGNNGVNTSHIAPAGADHVFSILSFGIYEVDVVDANGCSFRTTNIIASPPDDLDIEVSPTPSSCATGGTARVSVSTAILGTNYEFGILDSFASPYASTFFPPDVPSGETRTFTGLTPGVTYTFVVHDISTNCYYFETSATPVSTLSNMTASLDVVSNISCTGAVDGNVTFTFDNYDALATDVTYEIFHSQSNITTGFTGTTSVNPPTGPQTISNFAALPKGVYYILLSEVGGPFDGCPISTSEFTIEESTNLLDLTVASPKNDNCNLNAGVITAVAQYGTSPYEFQYLLNTDPAPIATSPGWTSSTNAYVESGDYIVYVKDANDCIIPKPVTVNLDPSPEISLAIINECVVEGAFEVLVTLDAAGVTPYLLSVNGAAFQNITFNASNEYTISGLNSGSAQTITIRDLNGCGETETFTIHPPLQFTALQTVLLDCEPGAAANAEITIEVTSGSGGYEVIIDGPGGVDLPRTAMPSNPYVWTDASAAGTYVISLFDINTTTPNCYKMVTIDVPSAVAPSFTETHIDVSCYGGTDGSITMTEFDNGVMPIAYDLTPMPAGAILNGLTFENIPAGTYDLRGIGSNGCFSHILAIEITQPDVVDNVNATVMEFGCAVGNGNNPDNAIITVDETLITGGSGTYVIYEFINDQGTSATADDVVVQTGSNRSYVETNVTGGSYIINVYDEKGCFGTTTASILPFDQLLPASLTVDQEITCANTGENVTINAFGTITDSSTPAGLANYEFRKLPSGVFQASNQFIDLSIGNHSFEVRNINTGCVVSISHTVQNPNTFEITTTTTDVVCFGTDGSVSFTISDAVNPYTGGFAWQIYESQGTVALGDDVLMVGANGVSTNVGPTPPFAIGTGEYRVEITQDSDPSCVNNAFFNIAGPSAPITANTEVTPITCVGNDGVIEIINANGGWGGYSYYVGTSSPTGTGDYVANPKFENLTAGTYEVWVIDNDDCQQMVQNNIVLVDPTPISASLQVNTPNCTNIEGELEVLGTTGGQGSNYTYQLYRNGSALGAPQTNTVFTGLGAGSYTVEVTDQWSCSFTTAAEILYDEIAPLATVVKAIDCSVNPGGEITITQTGGSGAFDYSVTYPDTITIVTNTTGVFTGLTQVGDYTFTVTDQATGHACTKTITQELVAAPVPILNIDSFTDVTCNMASDGTITVSAIDNGILPYTFEITAATGGTLALPYAPSIANNLSATFTGLEGSIAGITYTITATGANDCTTIITQTITQPDIIANVNAAVIEFGCAVGNGNNPDNAIITVDETLITGGSGTYVIYEFINDQGTVATGDDVVVQTGSNRSYVETDISGGTYIINVYDDNGCSGSTTATILPFDQLISATASITNDISCNPGNDGEITIAVTSTLNDASKLEYSIDNGANYQASNVFTGLGIGTHNFIIRHVDTGCILTASQTITDPNTFTIDTVVVNDVVCFGTNTGEVTFELVDATYPGGFDWQIFNTNGTPLNTTDDVSVATGTELVNGPTAIINLGAGDYLVNITQTNAPTCLNTDYFTIAGPSLALTANTNVTEVTCNTNDGSIEIINANGGWGGYTYFVGLASSPAPTYPGSYQASPLFTGLAGGVAPGTDYQVWVVDQRGCAHQLPNVNLVDPDPISATLSITQANCSNFEGELQVTGTAGGQGSNYTYQLYRNGSALGAPQTNTVFTGLGTGSYTVEVTDQWSCSFITAAEILYDEIAPLATVVKTIDCTVDPGGQITITQTGGSGAFDYSVTYPDTITIVTNTTGVFTGLTQVGDYTFTVTDQANSCSKTVIGNLGAAIIPIFSVTDFTDVTCNGADDGTISVSATDNGVGPYSFEIISGLGSTATFPILPTSNTTNSAIFTGLEGDAPGIDYTIRVTAANGCTLDVSQVILEPAIIDNVIASVSEFGCAVGNNPDNAIITVDETLITGGSGTYVIYEFINDQGTSATTADDVVVQTGSNRSYVETNVAGGSYIINVYDDNGCSGSTTAIILPFDELISATASITNDISCNPGNDGEITIAVTSTLNDASKLEYSIDNGANYQASNVFGGLGIGTYNFLIRHVDTGCIITASENIEEPNTFTIDINKLQDVICYGTETGEITLELVDATYVGPFDWTIYNTNGTLVNTADDTIEKSGTNATNGPTLPITLFAGSYLVTVSQINFPDCTNTEAFTISGPSTALTANTNVTEVTCSLDDGSIEIINANGGWGGYSYFVDLASNPAPTYPGSYQVSPLFTGLSGGIAPGTDYQVWVVDQKGCAHQLPNVNLIDPEPINASIQVNQENCTNLQGIIEVVGTIGGQQSNYSYQLIKNGSTFGGVQSSTIFSGLGAGSYEVLVTDQWSCSFTTTAELLYEEMNLLAAVVKPIDCTVTPGGEITITVNGGSANLEYIATFPDGTTTVTNNSGIFTGLPQVGVYTFVVNDLDTTNPVCSKTITQTLDAPTPVTFDLHILDHVSCNGLSDGAITINLVPMAVGVNDNPPYAYSLYDATGATLLAGPQASPTFTGLSAAFYQVEAISSRGCPLRETVEIEEPTQLIIDATATTFACDVNNGATTATVTVTIMDGATTPGTPSGTGPYLYSLDNTNFQTSNTFDVIDTGVVQDLTIYVVDANTCPTTATVSIQPLNTFTVSVSQTTAISCVGPEEVLLSVTDDGNPNIYTFELLPIGNTVGTQTATTSNTATYDLLAVGSYTFRVTDTATGCYVDTAPYDIAPYDLIEVSAVAVDPVICFGDSNGSLMLNVSGYIGTYDYEVFTQAGATVLTGSGNTASNPLPISGLSGGNYFVRVTETAYPLCVENSNIITIISPDMALTAVVDPIANVTCTNDQGEILVNPSGGYAPYDIVLTNTTTNQTYNADDVMSAVFSGLSAGDFDVVITDSTGCPLNDTETLVAPLPISANATPLTTTFTCYGDTNGSVSAINVINGSGSYVYQLNHYDAAGTVIDFTSGTQASPNFNNLGAGVYSITISDGWNCDYETNQVTITQPTQIEATLLRTDPLTCATGVEFELTASGGSGSYEYSLDNISFTPMTSNPMPLPESGVLGAGSYQYYVRDLGGACASVASNSISENPIVPLSLIVDRSAAIINCNGESTAIIYASAQGGLGNYQFELYTDASLSVASRIAGPQSVGEFRGLPQGTYFVTVTSDDCETLPEEVTITEPTPLSYTEDVVNVSCFGEGNGSIAVTLSGGSGGYLYAISPNLNQFDTINTFTDLTPGDYTIIAQDVNGCFELLEYTITQPEALNVSATSTPEICIGEENGTISVTISGGTAPYSTSLNDKSDFVLNRVDFSDLAAGSYLIFVRDALGCENNTVIEVEPGQNLNAIVDPVYECDSDLPTNYVNITMEDPSVLGSIMYALDSVEPDDMQLTPDFRNIAPGMHTITIVHENGCLNTIDFEIQGFEPLTLELQNNAINEITAIATGGRGEYTFYFDNENNGPNNTYIIYRTDTYEVRVVDENGCEVIANIEMEFIDIEIPNFFTPDGDGQNDIWMPMNIEAYPEILIKIFDRYGRVVEDDVVDKNGWDGLYHGTELPTGDYWYVIKLKADRDDREFVGHFTLYR